MWYGCDVMYAVLYLRVNCFVVRGCAVSRRYIPFATELFIWVCYRFLIILDKIVHHISNESEDM